MFLARYMKVPWVPEAEGYRTNRSERWYVVVLRVYPTGGRRMRWFYRRINRVYERRRWK